MRQTWRVPLAKADAPVDEPPPPATWKWLLDLASTFEPAVRRAFLRALTRSRSRVDEPALRAALEAGRVQDALDALHVDEIVPEALAADLSPELGAVFEAAGSSAPARTLGASIGMRFDIRNPKAAEFLRTYDFGLIRQLSDDTREGIRRVITNAFERGGHPYVQARLIRDSIGLTDSQAAAVDSYRTLLETSDRAVLLRALRDRRFDPTVRAAMEGRSRGMTPEQIDKMVGRYRDRYIDLRAQTIARSETMRASNSGKLMAWQQAAANGLISNSVRRFWLVTPDDRLAVVGPRTKVMTIGGWKAISKIEVGDKVLTHKDRFREVVSLDKRRFNGPIVTVEVGGRAGNKVTVTHEHRILVYRNGADEWVYAKDLLDDDEFYINAAPCADCGALIPSGYRMATEVCAPCSAKRSNASRWSKDGERERLVAQNDARWAKPGAREAQRQKFTKLLEERGDEIIAKGLSARGRNHAGHSFLERKMRWFLESQQIPFEAQWFFTYDRNGKRTRGYADFVITGRKIVIECDGPLHQEPETVARDADRDAALKAMGYSVMRFCDHHIRREFGAVADAIKSRCCLMRVKAKRIVRRQTNHQACYDLQVAEDESFVAGGIVVHNCEFCEAVPDMNPDGVGLDEPFKTPFGPTLISSLHPRCRCTDYLGSTTGAEEAQADAPVDELEAAQPAPEE